MSAFIDYVKNQDLRVLYLVNRSMKCRLLDVIMNTVTQLGSLPVAIAVPLVFIISPNPQIKAAGRSIAAVLVLSQIIVQFLKWAVNRPRPCKTLDNLIPCSVCAPGFSFPSGHTSTAFAVAISLGYFFPVTIAPLISLAILVGISRIYLGVHYPSDVLVGSIIAWAVFLVYI